MSEKAEFIDHIQDSHRISRIKFPDFSMIIPEFSTIFQHWREAKMTCDYLKKT